MSAFYSGSGTARTARFSKKSLGSDVGEIKKMSEKLKKKSVLTPRNVREKSNTVIYYKTPTLTIRRSEIKKWDINLYLCDFLLNRAVRAVPEPIHNFCFGEMICCVYIVVILSPTKLGRDIVTLPSFRNILVNTLESTSFNGF
jgi:hypothetical protein